VILCMYICIYVCRKFAYVSRYCGTFAYIENKSWNIEDYVSISSGEENYSVLKAKFDVKNSDVIIKNYKNANSSFWSVEIYSAIFEAFLPYTSVPIMPYLNRFYCIKVFSLLCNVRIVLTVYKCTHNASFESFWPYYSVSL
jgi:hypothetical protein